MANRDSPRECIGYFDWVSCRLPSCPYNTTGVKVSRWWLFLCLCYISFFLVGIPFAVLGFASMGNEVAAVGVVLVIVGACLAFVCDLLRRCGCGWTKITLESTYPRRIFQEISHVVLAIPFLPGYPGVSTPREGTESDNPPPYAISQGFEKPDLTFPCTCMETSVNVIGSAHVPEDTGGGDARQTITSFATQDREVILRTVNVTEVGSDFGAPTSYDGHGTLNPPPPPYDFEMTDSQDRISWSHDIPPPYGDFV